jgi:hypothetical protein
VNSIRNVTHKKLRNVVRIVLSTLAVSGGLAAAIHYIMTKDPTPIRMDLKIYDDYAGYYVFPDGHSITIRREGDHLMSSLPGRLPMELFPETETQFFHKGLPSPGGNARKRRKKERRCRPTRKAQMA